MSNKPQPVTVDQAAGQDLTRTPRWLLEYLAPIPSCLAERDELARRNRLGIGEPDSVMSAKALRTLLTEAADILEIDAEIMRGKQSANGMWLVNDPAGMAVYEAYERSLGAVYQLRCAAALEAPRG